MFAKSARYYDLFKRNKPYEEEAAAVERILATITAFESPDMLIVASGTGEHDRFLKSKWRIVGLDLNPDFIATARLKNPECEYIIGNMMELQTDSRFDVVLGMYGCIGYCGDRIGLAKAMSGFARCLKPGGVVAIEPWYTPATWLPEKVHITQHEGGGIIIRRIGVGKKNGDIDFTYIVSERGCLDVFEESYSFGLFELSDLIDAAGEAGLEFIDLFSSAILRRGLFVARKQG